LTSGNQVEAEEDKDQKSFPGEIYKFKIINFVFLKSLVKMVNEFIVFLKPIYEVCLKSGWTLARAAL